MQLISHAKTAFFSGQYLLAADLYQRAMAEQPELAHLYLITLNMARRKLGLDPLSERDLPVMPLSSPVPTELSSPRVDAAGGVR